MKHKNKPLSLDQLLRHIHIENEARNRDILVNRKDENVHIVEKQASGGFKPKNEKGKKNSYNNKRKKNESNGKDKKKKGPCFVCGKEGHLARVCKYRKGQKKQEADVVEEDDYVAMLTEIFMVDIDQGWWIDSGATCHVTPHREVFTTYEPYVGEKSVFMGNSSSCSVKGIGMVKIPFSSGKMLTLKDVLHIPRLHKSLLSVKKLDDNGFKVVFESNKVILSKKGSFVGKGYA